MCQVDNQTKMNLYKKKTRCYRVRSPHVSKTRGLTRAQKNATLVNAEEREPQQSLSSGLHGGPCGTLARVFARSDRTHALLCARGADFSQVVFFFWFSSLFTVIRYLAREKVGGMAKSREREVLDLIVHDVNWEKESREKCFTDLGPQRPRRWSAPNFAKLPGRTRRRD